MSNIRYLSRNDVISLQLPMRDVINAVELAFVEKGHGRIEMPPKPGIHPLPDAFIHAMPAYIPSMKAVGVKWVSGFPQNMPKNLPYISGLLILNDAETGIPLCVMDCTWITGMRTGAATAVAAKYLAPPESKTVGILGCGVQGRCNLDAIKETFPRCARLLAYDRNTKAAEAVCSDASSQWGFETKLCLNAAEACEDADIIVTAAAILKDPSPVLERSWLKSRVFLSPVDFDSYIKPEIFKAADLFYTDDVAQQQYYRKIGYFKNIPEPQGDLGEILTHQKRGRNNTDKITIAMNLGIALEDMATAALVYESAVKANVGTLLPA